MSLFPKLWLAYFQSSSQSRVVMEGIWQLAKLTTNIVLFLHSELE